MENLSPVITGLLGALVSAIITHRLTIWRMKENNKLAMFSEAGKNFRFTVINELTGLYPINQGWYTDNFPRLLESIQAVNTAAAEFRYFVKSQTAFDKAVAEYNEYCRKTTYAEVQAYEMYDKSRKPGDIGPKNRFNNIVNHLLSFADSANR